MYTYTRTYVLKHLYIQGHTYEQQPQCVHLRPTCMHVYEYICICVDVLIRIYTHTFVHTARTHTYIYSYIRTYRVTLMRNSL